MGQKGRADWARFLAWIVVGVLLGFGMTALGLFTLPLALGLGIYLYSRTRAVSPLACLAGVAGTVAVFAAMNLGYEPCTSGPHTSVLGPGESSSSYSCGGMNGDAVLIPALMVFAGAVGFHLWRHRPPPFQR
jgi:hypothetical protein